MDHVFLPVAEPVTLPYLPACRDTVLIPSGSLPETVFLAYSYPNTPDHIEAFFMPASSLRQHPSLPVTGSATVAQAKQGHAAERHCFGRGY